QLGTSQAVKRGHAAALVLALAAGAHGCGKDQATSVYLEVTLGTGVPRPTKVTIDIFDGDGVIGVPRTTVPALLPQASGDLLGTLVIYPSAQLTRLTIR